jgi:hypothetical protein
MQYLITVLLSENSMGIYPAGLKVKPDVFLHDICERIFCQPVFFFVFAQKMRSRTHLLHPEVFLPVSFNHFVMSNL